MPSELHIQNVLPSPRETTGDITYLLSQNQGASRTNQIPFLHNRKKIELAN